MVISNDFHVLESVVKTFVVAVIAPIAGCVFQVTETDHNLHSPPLMPNHRHSPLERNFTLKWKTTFSASAVGRPLNKNLTKDHFELLPPFKFLWSKNSYVFINRSRSCLTNIVSRIRTIHRLWWSPRSRSFYVHSINGISYSDTLSRNKNRCCSSQGRK